ncbi:MAG: pseudouridine synthase [Lachnospiraceae bacterium]|nr:pseudouridine synthase [Lachnospiraceae bacterium]
MRINKYLSSHGICSRREADRAIVEGKVLVNSAIASPGMDVSEGDEVLFYGQRVGKRPEIVVLAYWKKVGTVSSTVNQGKEQNNIVDEVGFESRVYPVGRLDKDSEGIILLTNDGELANSLLKSSNGHEKEYEVLVDREISESDLLAIRKGGLQIIPEEKRLTKPCKMERLGNKRYSLILTEGMNREIRRIMEFFGYQVESLKRTRFVTVTLDGLRPGEYRMLNHDEVEELRNLGAAQK